MKPTEGDQSAKNMNNSKDQKKCEEVSPSPSTSTKDPADESEQVKDDLFEPTVDMLVNDFDEEQTLEEEEALAAKDGHDPGVELNDLQRESEMPLEELMKLYGYGQPMAETSSSSAGSSSRKRRRRQDKSPPSPPKQVKKEEENLVEATDATVQISAEESTVTVEDGDSPDEDATTTTTNNLENTSIVDDETNYEDEEEPSELKKLYTAENEEDIDEEDLDYVPEEEGKKVIMVGSDYQAVIPEGLLKYDDALPYENEDKLLWDPSKMSDIDLEDYLNKFSSTSNGHSTVTAATTTPPPCRSRRDDEQALLLLLQCGNNLEEALRRRRLGPIQPTSIWSEEECRNFENGIKLFGKSFHEIQSSKVKTRSVGELVEFYYLWKKTERADAFGNKARLDKKKFLMNQNTSDIMDKFLEEYDGTSRDRSVSPNVNSLLNTDMKRSHRSDTSANNNDHKASIKQVTNLPPNAEESSVKVTTEQ